MSELGNSDKQAIGRWANNQVENSHLPFRRQAREMRRFRRMSSLPKFTSIHANVHNHFNAECRRFDRPTFKIRRSDALTEWQSLMSSRVPVKARPASRRDAFALV
jgi:putative transposase